MRPEVLLAIAIAFIASFFALQVFLFVLFYREQVKKALREKACRPIHIRWQFPLLWKTYPFNSTRFNVVYSDWNDSIHQASCIVYRPLLENPFWGSFRVEWLTDVVIGRDTPEVQVDSEIIRPKLNNPDDSSETKNLPGE